MSIVVRIIVKVVVAILLGAAGSAFFYFGGGFVLCQVDVVCWSPWEEPRSEAIGDRLADFTRATQPFDTFFGEQSVTTESVIGSDCKNDRCLRVEYEILSPPSADQPGGLVVDLAGDDLVRRESESLCLEVAGLNGGELFEVGLTDTAGADVEVEVDEYLLLPVGEWQLLDIPLSRFSPVNLHSVETVYLHFHDRHGSGSLLLGELFVSVDGPCEEVDIIIQDVSQPQEQGP